MCTCSMYTPKPYLFAMMWPSWTLGLLLAEALLPARGQEPVQGVPRASWSSYREGGASFNCRDGLAIIPMSRLNGEPYPWISLGPNVHLTADAGPYSSHSLFRRLLRLRRRVG